MTSSQHAPDPTAAERLTVAAEIDDIELPDIQKGAVTTSLAQHLEVWLEPPVDPLDDAPLRHGYLADTIHFFYPPFPEQVF